MYECPQCSLTFTRLWNLKRHTSDQHTKDNSVRDSCTTIDSLTSQINRLSGQVGAGKIRGSCPPDSDESDAYNNSDSSGYDSAFSRESSGTASGFSTESDDEEIISNDHMDSAVLEEENAEENAEEENAEEDDEKEEEEHCDWRLSRRYRLHLPWKYFGEVKIRKHKQWLKHLLYADVRTLIYNIKHASDSELLAFNEIAYNIRYGGPVIMKTTFKSIKKRLQSLRLIGSLSPSIREIRRELLKTGPPFVNLLLDTIAPLLNDPHFRSRKKNKKVKKVPDNSRTDPSQPSIDLHGHMRT